MSRHVLSAELLYRKKKEERKRYILKIKILFFTRKEIQLTSISSRLMDEFKETSRDATSCFQRVHRQNGERHSKWYELAFSESITFPLRPFSFIDAIVFERCWLDSLFLLLFVVSSSSFFFLGRRGNRGVFNSWYVSLAVTHGARCFGGRRAPLFYWDGGHLGE